MCSDAGDAAGLMSSSSLLAPALHLCESTQVALDPSLPAGIYSFCWVGVAQIFADSWCAPGGPKVCAELADGCGKAHHPSWVSIAWSSPSNRSAVYHATGL